MRFFLILFFLLMLLDTARSAESFIPKSFSGEFTQSKESIHSVGKNKRIITSEVSIKYLSPGHIRFRDGETGTLYICNTQNVYKYDPPFIEGERGSLEKGDAESFCYAKLFDSLRYGLKDNKNYTVKKLADNKYELDFNKQKKQALGVSKVKLEFLSKARRFEKLKRLAIYFNGQQKPVSLKTKKLEINTKISKEIFNFIPPKNTNIQLMK